MIYKGLLKSTCLVLCGKCLVRPLTITFPSRRDYERAGSRSIVQFDQLTPSADANLEGPTACPWLIQECAKKGRARIESPQPGTPFESFAAKSGRAPRVGDRLFDCGRLVLPTNRAARIGSMTDSSVVPSRLRRPT
jgi:hypothetical protein